MELQIDEKKENALLKRDEIKFTILSEGATPSRKDVEGALAKELGVDKGLLVIRRISSVYGAPSAKGIAMVYKSKEGMGIEKEYLLARKGLAPKKEEKKPEKKVEKKEEKPKEEKAKPEEKEAKKEKEAKPEEEKEKA